MADKRVVKIEIDNCTLCPHHLVVADPDLEDSFCRDDKAIVCTKVRGINNKRFNNPGFQDYMPITTACRPYNLKKEASIPEQCPLLV